MAPTPSPSLDTLSLLGHPLRAALLRRLMRQPATLSQLGSQFGESPAHIQHHLKALLAANWAELTPDTPTRHPREKYYRAAASAWLIDLAILPEVRTGETAVVLGSNDPATLHIAHHFRDHPAGLTVHRIPLNSLDGLLRVQQGLCHMATCHLKEPGAARYNRSYVDHIFPGQSVALLRLFVREGGLIVAAGNPKAIRGLADLTRPDLRIINREHGAGLRVWLDQELARLGLPAEALIGYHQTATSHLAVAEAICCGAADAGLGLAGEAADHGLGFVPLFAEPYDLVLPGRIRQDPAYQPLFEYLVSLEFRTAIRAHPGYQVPLTSGVMDAPPAVVA